MDSTKNRMPWLGEIGHRGRVQDEKAKEANSGPCSVGLWDKQAMDQERRKRKLHKLEKKTTWVVKRGHHH